MYVPIYSQVCRVLGMYQGYILTSNLDIYRVHVLAKVRSHFFEDTSEVLGQPWALPHSVPTLAPYGLARPYPPRK